LDLRHSKDEGALAKVFMVIAFEICGVDIERAEQGMKVGKSSRLSRRYEGRLSDHVNVLVDVALVDLVSSVLFLMLVSSILVSSMLVL